jgi:hypothetical protein
MTGKFMNDDFAPLLHVHCNKAGLRIGACPLAL